MPLLRQNEDCTPVSDQASKASSKDRRANLHRDSKNGFTFHRPSEEATPYDACLRHAFQNPMVIPCYGHKRLIGSWVVARGPRSKGYLPKPVLGLVPCLRPASTCITPWHFLNHVRDVNVRIRHSGPCRASASSFKFEGQVSKITPSSRVAKRISPIVVERAPKEQLHKSTNSSSIRGTGISTICSKHPLRNVL